MSKRKFAEIYEVDYDEEGQTCQSEFCGQQTLYEFKVEGMEKPIRSCSSHLHRQTILAQVRARKRREQVDSMQL